MRPLLMSLALVGLVAGCQPPKTSVRFTTSTSSPAPVQTSATQIVIPVGLAIGVHAVPLIGDAKAPPESTLTFTPRDSGVIGIRPSIGTEYPFVIFGAREGTTIIDVALEDAEPTQITATVTAPVDQ